MLFSSFPQVHCGAGFTIYQLFDNLVAAEFAPDQLLKQNPGAHLSPMELQVWVGNKKATMGITDSEFQFGWVKILKSEVPQSSQDKCNGTVIYPTGL